MHGDSPVIAFRVGFGFTISLLSLFLISSYQTTRAYHLSLAVMRFSFFTHHGIFYDLSVSVLIILNTLPMAR